ncbi:hypothetical protein MLD38_011555 [Melastoma candidum]|uniref:Uncharacterized protein n=1 Tax=Melastoma candidum TaxID=119954 RepID=A0ACB9R6Z6_9MYRT|nr:hypothetical protein MLD38_011555 [Melastoma candidum]
MNARFLSWVWKIGIEMERKFDRMEIERIIRSLMTQEEGRKLRQTALKLKEEVERCVQDGGATSNSLNELIKHILSL